MAEADIPVDLFNPGQVFASLGFLEAAEILCGGAEGGFDWDDEADVRFRLHVADERNPFEVVLEFLAYAEPQCWAPKGYVAVPPKKGKSAENSEEENEENNEGEDANDTEPLTPSETFPAAAGDRMALPVRLGGGNRPVVELGNWTDGSSRQSFKLYAGNRSAFTIIRAMLLGVAKKPSSRGRTTKNAVQYKTKGIAQLWQEARAQLVASPFDVLTPMGGSFNFDARGAWTAIDAGYSPNDQKHAVLASPVVEFLAAWGLEHARPRMESRRGASYGVWNRLLPPILARVALSGTMPVLSPRNFAFGLDLAGRNKVVTFSHEEQHHDGIKLI